MTHVHQQVQPFSRVFDRLPVLVGRDGNVANCVLPDDHVSRVHASLDIRDGRICVRDSGSTNGTFVGESRLPSDRWVATSGLGIPCEIRVGQWLLTIAASEHGPAPGGDEVLFLTAEPGPSPAPGPPSALLETLVSKDVSIPPPRAAYDATQVVDDASLRVHRAWSALCEARNELISMLAEVFDAASVQERARLAREIVRTCAQIEREPGVRAIFERHGQAPLPLTLESAAALAIQELARWYVGGVLPLANANEVFAFARKLKAGIDELLLGLLPMFAGLDRFEQQVALKPNTGAGMDAAVSSRLPRVPRDAARALFDWRDATDGAVRAVRTDLVDLTMHQVAVLNGVMRGVKVLLTELSPEVIDHAWRRRLSQRGLMGRLLGSLRAAGGRWSLYRERHSDLADEENERFRVIFGPEFVAEYKQSGEGATVVVQRPARLPVAQQAGQQLPPHRPQMRPPPAYGNPPTQAWPPEQRAPHPPNRK